MWKTFSVLFHFIELIHFIDNLMQVYNVSCWSSVPTFSSFSPTLTTFSSLSVPFQSSFGVLFRHTYSLTRAINMTIGFRSSVRIWWVHKYLHNRKFRNSLGIPGPFLHLCLAVGGPALVQTQYNYSSGFCLIFKAHGMLYTLNSTWT